MKEQDWAQTVVERIQAFVTTLSSAYGACVSQKLIYSHEIRQYRNDDPEVSNKRDFETDILVFEYIDDEIWIPRLVIETKIGRVSTHDAITFAGQQIIQHAIG